MALCAFLNYVYVILTYILLVPSSIGYAQTVELSVSPKEDLYLSNNFAFFVCSVEGLDLGTMSVAWTHNGVVFADAVIDGRLQLRSNVDSTFAVEVNEDDFETSDSLRENPGGGYRATLDVLTNVWQYSGEYQCVVCNKNLNNDKCAQIQISSNEVSLRVAYFPPEPYPLLETSAQQDNSMVLLGVETVVSCYSFPGNPDVEFSLLRGIGNIQGNIIKSGDFIFYNYTFTPTIDDNGVIFTCSISNTIPTTPEVTSVRTNSMSALQVVSIPKVKIEGPTVIGYGFSLTLTCSATSATNTPIVSYTWSVRDLAASRYRVDFDTLTVQSIVEGDGGVVVSCQAIDELGMEGSELYTINAMDPEDITSMVPSTLPPVINEPPVALIVVLSVVGVILLILLIGALGYYCRNKKSSPKSGRSFDSKPAMTSSTNKKDNHYPNSTNGPYTITGNMSNSPKPDIVDGYGNSKYYPTDVDYRQSPTAPMYNDHDDYKPPYERTRSQEPFYPGYEKSPEYHYNAGYGYDDENQPYPEDKDEILVGDFTQPSDRQPAYGQGYDDNNDRDDDRHYPDEYHDSNSPYDYVNRDQDGFNREPAGYDDREPASYDDREPASYSNREPASYDGREPASFDDREPASYDDREPATYDGGYVRGVEEYDGDVPRDNNYNDEYYPPGESYPPEDRYKEPNSAHYDDEYPEDRGDMYPKEEGNYPLEYEPYGKRDQVPDGQESDFQGEPNNDQYYPPLDLMPDGGPRDDDPYYGYNISTQLDEFDDPQKHHNESVSSERFDPSYV